MSPATIPWFSVRPRLDREGQNPPGEAVRTGSFVRRHRSWRDTGRSARAIQDRRAARRLSAMSGHLQLAATRPSESWFLAEISPLTDASGTRFRNDREVDLRSASHEPRTSLARDHLG